MVDAHADDDDGHGLSAYERQREENIRENNWRLRELGLLAGEDSARSTGGGSSSSSSLLGLAHGGSQPSITAKKKRSRPAAPEGEQAKVTEPQRRSSRVRREQPAEVYVADEDAITGKVMLGGADAGGFAMADAKAIDLTHPDELPITTDDLTEAERAVYEVLRAARNAKARAMERSMFIVCNDRTLCEMVRLVPAELDELYEMYGMGEKKVRAHGQMLLDALAPHADELRAGHAATRLRADATPALVQQDDDNSRRAASTGTEERAAADAQHRGVQMEKAAIDDDEDEDEPLALRKVRRDAFGAVTRRSPRTVHASYGSSL